MRIFIDHFKNTSSIAKDLKKRIQQLNLANEVILYKDISDLEKDSKEGEEKVIKELENISIFIPILSESYLTENSKLFHKALFKYASKENNYLFPFIYSPSRWSSFSWIVKSKIFPSNSIPYVQLSEIDKESTINNLVQTIENIINEDLQKSPLLTKNLSAKSNDYIFISHSHEDSDFAELIKNKLSKEGLDGWIDIDRLKIGQDWRKEIDVSIMKSLAVIVIMTPEARKSEYVTYEWAFAWGNRKKIFPLMLKQTGLHPRLETLHYLDFTNRYSRPWENLMHSIKKIKN